MFDVLLYIELNYFQKIVEESDLLKSKRYSKSQEFSGSTDDLSLKSGKSYKSYESRV